MKIKAMKRKGPVSKCYWKKFKKDGKWRPVLCQFAFGNMMSLLSMAEKALDKKDREITRLKKKLEKAKE